MARILPRDVLRGRPTVVATDVDDAHQRIAELFCGHDLVPQAHVKSVDMKLRSLHRGDVGIEYLDYGAEVRINPEGLEDFHLVQIPLAGHARLNVGSETVDSSPRMATVPPVDRPFSMTWDSGTPHLIVYIKRIALASVATQLYGEKARDGVPLGYALDLAASPGRAFLRSVVELHDDMISQGSSTAPVFVQQLLVDTMLSRLLMAMEGAPDGGEGGNTDSKSLLIRRFRELLERHASEELAVPDIAENLGVSVRTLQSALRSELGATPSEVLRSVRLDRAREMLLAAEPGQETIVSIAERCGFSHQGRFSALYLDAFGELPSVSLRR
ncbi:MULTISPECIES: AraC family transcriptional regulator [Arthrobacter]|uniref:AraC family transcriptional regulator n=1 Tax=Arthrobacter terricola TaxID=2547396 RepID=A0A4R5KDE3_9MICC|nr:MULTISPECIES: AraC family transcriptional regulator [Arthrobacter]MBT8162376.1 AraC family transcriptional regulator [Arthrobacter sp. GN70]TDF93369.1 AraC family transcriptional regulator [Arthrobacter terricola]